jgi:hypothetical protein
MLVWGCGGGEIIATGPTADKAITIVKSYKPEGSIYSVISNIERNAFESKRDSEDEWKMGQWEAGMPGQKDLLLDRLSEYFTFVRPTGDYWVRFTYQNKSGTHVALWNTNVYSRKVEAQTDAAQEFIRQAGTLQAVDRERQEDDVPILPIPGEN